MSNKSYYHQDLEKFINFIIPKNTKTIFIDVNNGNILQPRRGFYEYIVLNNKIGELKDIQGSLMKLKQYTNNRSRLVITYYNHLWEPLLKFATFMGWRKNVGDQNWLNEYDISNFLHLSDYEVISIHNRLLLPFNIPVVTKLFNQYLAHIPYINNVCLTRCVVSRPKNKTAKKEYSVTIVIPCRNEEGNVSKIIDRIPKFAKWQEIIFVEGHSKDNTWVAIQKQIKTKRSKNIKVKAYHQTGKGKADAVRLGFLKAKGEVLMILDADMTVPPADLNKFYNAISEGKGEFINGSRLVYPMENDAMQTLNKVGNRIFSWLFTWILGQHFRDTLCGTKVLLKKDYNKIVKGRKYFGDFDPFGDFDLIFGAVKQNLKVLEVPVRYKERVYGYTNISRISHGFLLAKMTIFAFKKFKL